MAVTSMVCTHADLLEQLHLIHVLLQESSPRSDEELVQEEAAFFDYHQQVKLAIDNVQGLNKSKFTLTQGTFDIQKSRVNKTEEQNSSDDVRSSNDSGCSVDSSSDKTRSKNVPKLKFTESQNKKEKVRNDSKKKSSSPRSNCTHSRTNQRSSCGQNENCEPKNVSITGKTVTQPQKSNAQDVNLQSKKTADNSRNTHVTVVKAPTVDTAVAKSIPSNVPSSSNNENKTRARSTYQTSRTAPSIENISESNDKYKPDSAAKELVPGVPTCDTQSTPKVNSKADSGNLLQQNGNQSTKCNLTQKSNGQGSSQKTVPPPRPAAPPRQNSNLVKSKPIKKENSTVGLKSMQNNVVSSNKPCVSKQQPKPGNSKPVVPPRPQSVLSGNTKQPEIPQTAAKTTPIPVGTQSPKATVHKPKSAAKSTTAPTSQTVAKQNVPVATHEDLVKNKPATVGVPAEVGVKKDPPQVPPRPRSVNAKLIKVASSESSPKDLQATFTIETKPQSEKLERETSICKITINGKESTVPDYNPRSREIQARKVSNDSTRNIAGRDKDVLNPEEAKIDRVYSVKVTKVNRNTISVEGGAEVKFVPRPESSDHEGPVIWDPFEHIREQNKKSTDQLDVKEEEGKGRIKSAKLINNKLTVSGSRKTSAKNRNTSATKRNVKIKATIEANRNLRPKSPKKKGVKKKKKIPNGGKDLTTKGDPENMAFVSGIGWHLDYDQAPTFTKVRPFKFIPPGDYSSEEEDYSHTLRVLPDYSTALCSKNATPRSFREVDTLLPNMTVSLEELEEYTSADESADEYVDAEDVLDDIAEFSHPRDSMKDDENSACDDSTPSKTLTNVTTLSSNYKSSNLPHVAQATKVTVQQTDLGSSQKVQATTVPDIENINSKPVQSAKNKTATAKIIAVKSAAKENKLKTTKDVSPHRTPLTVNPSGLSPNSQRNAKKQVSNPISPGASVPERRPSFSRAILPEKFPGSSPSDPEKSQKKSIRTEKTKIKPKHEPLALAKSEEIEEDNNHEIKVKKDQRKQNKEVKTTKVESQEKEHVEPEKKTVRNSNEDLENIIDEIIKTTPTGSFKSNDKEGLGNKKKRQKKHWREKFEKETRGSHEGKTFRQVMLHYHLSNRFQSVNCNKHVVM